MIDKTHQVRKPIYNPIISPQLQAEGTTTKSKRIRLIIKQKKREQKKNGRTEEKKQKKRLINAKKQIKWSAQKEIEKKKMNGKIVKMKSKGKK